MAVKPPTYVQTPNGEVCLFYTNCFSQWHPSIFGVDEIGYSHAEQYMMAEKARLFNDSKTERKIMEAAHPREQKELGREVKNFDREKWDAVARDIVYKGNYHKFRQNPSMLLELGSTRDALLVEASAEDRIWGVGLAQEDMRAANPSLWLGTNWLGEVLMKLRDDIRDGIVRTSNFGWKV
jgi:ribA/ribD-fused uncharacterized protein